MFEPSISTPRPVQRKQAGGVLSAEEVHDKAMQEALEKLDQMLKDVKN